MYNYQLHEWVDLSHMRVHWDQTSTSYKFYQYLEMCCNDYWDQNMWKKVKSNQILVKKNLNSEKMELENVFEIVIIRVCKHMLYARVKYAKRYAAFICFLQEHMLKRICFFMLFNAFKCYFLVPILTVFSMLVIGLTCFFQSFY